MDSVGPKLLASQQPCPYIEGKTETLFHVVFPEYSSDQLSLRDSLIDTFWCDFGSHGYRRQGRLVYRPYCSNCEACIATRVLVSEFRMKRRFRRIVRANADIRVEVSREKLVSDHEAFRLYDKYIKTRHTNGSMYPPDFNTLRTMLHLEPDRSDFHVYGFLGDQLVFIAQTDRLVDGFSANYTIFDTDMSERSLGTFAILTQIELARCEGLDHLYLGFALDAVKNMRYKMNFQPQQRLIDDEWIRFDENQK
ncbi:MAG: arginyl-tRNA--protein transferase [Gammaproteobacteria bacterium]|nr:arginyl-tRNA--protein transferase [Gammaproteobacteria bacterium]